MPEPAPEAAAPAGGKQPFMKRKVLGMPMPVALAALAGVGAVAFIFLRKKSSASTGTATAGQACTDANGNPGTFDTQGNCVTNEQTAGGTDLSGEPCTDASGNPGLTDAIGNCLASAQLSTTTGTGTGTTPTGPCTTATGAAGTYDASGVCQPNTTTTTTPPTPAKPPSPAAPTKAMPNLVGQRANFAIGELKTGYGVTAHTSPLRNPKDEYVVTAQTPKAGTQVKSGSTATLNVKVIKT